MKRYLSFHMHFGDLSDIVEGASARVVKDQPITRLVIDSRKVVTAPGALFFALPGPNHNGHDFLQEVYKKGIRQFVISQANASLPEDCNVLLVPDTLLAAQQIAADHRKQFDIPVVGITGSNGKTIVKEWLATVLGANRRVVKSPKSYNSQIGVPLSVWQMNDKHEVAIFEAGISRSGEMQQLANILEPTIGIFTNIGSAHDDGFADRAEKIKEKLTLFDNCQLLIYCRDHEEIHQAIEAKGITSVRSWSYQNRGNVDVQYQDQEFVFSMPGGDVYRFQPKYTDPSSLENLAHCIVACLSLGLTKEEMAAGLSRIENLQMRLTIKEAENGCYVIDDTYNNDLSAIDVATDFLLQQSQRKKKAVILSDIIGSGMVEEQLYQHVADLLQRKKIDRLIGIGHGISKYAKYFSGDSRFFPDKTSFLSSAITFRDEIILVKGARVFELESIVNHLARKTHGTVLEVNMEAIAHNLQWYRSLLSSNVKMMVMVKALAYGGSYEVANLLQYHGVDYLGVAYADEGA
ncbi:MAG: UDP-N-acetylmuramoyl-tripeptide--D-alanyl-D-alanine ligase, partial [Bacteroidota bacterium]